MKGTFTDTTIRLKMDVELNVSYRSYPRMFENHFIEKPHKYARYTKWHNIGYSEEVSCVRNENSE